MNRTWRLTICALALLAYSPAVQGQAVGGDVTRSEFDEAASTSQRDLDESLAELATLREAILEVKLPLSRRLNELETLLIEARQQHQQTTRILDSRALDFNNLQTEIKSREEESAYLSNLLSEYIRNLESRMHIAELQRYHQPLEVAKLAVESGASPQEVFEAQTALVALSVDRLHEAIGGARFEGSAVDSNGMVSTGTFVMTGPAVAFRSQDGKIFGIADQRLGSLLPTVLAVQQPQAFEVAAPLFRSDGVGPVSGEFPLDATLGEAHKVAAINETLWEHIQKGGPVMIPIFVLAGFALLLALRKWIGMLAVRKPPRRKVQAVLQEVARGEKNEVLAKARSIGGPAGKMLQAGAEHFDEPHELIEEVMYETVLATRLKLQRFLPFIAISAAAAPLLGLLGTVTGIMNTFALITVFGTGDVKTLSSGISEALITTEFGLIVAIPSLLIHAFLSRKAKAVIEDMEQVAVAFINQVRKSRKQETSVPSNIVAPSVQPSQQETSAKLAADSLTELLSLMREGMAARTTTTEPSVASQPVVQPNAQ